jgi:hypothetical protein
MESGSLWEGKVMDGGGGHWRLWRAIINLNIIDFMEPEKL